MKRILIITEVFPSGLTGTSVKTRNTIEHLLNLGFIIDVCCLHHPDMVLLPLTHRNLKIYVNPWKTYQRRSLVYIFRLLSQIFTFVPYQIKQVYSGEIEKQTSTLIEQNKYTYIFYDGYSILQYLNRKKSSAIYIDDEDFTELYRNRYVFEKNIFKKIFYLTEFWKSGVYEKKKFKYISQIWAISQNTFKRFQNITSAKISVMPTLVPFHKSVWNSLSSDIVFTGTLNWEENVNGLNWFLENCWKEIHNQKPNVLLYISGQLADSNYINYLQSFPNIKYIGYEKDLAKLYSKCALAISPVFINAGIKVKILTYMGYGLPVVALKISTLGLSSLDGILVANNSQEFIDAVIYLLNDKKLRQQLSEEGLNNIKKNHSKTKLKKFLIAVGIS
jgi:polysaccharide biosynthesis protein PslH